MSNQKMSGALHLAFIDAKNQLEDLEDLASERYTGKFSYFRKDPQRIPRVDDPVCTAYRFIMMYKDHEWTRAKLEDTNRSLERENMRLRSEVKNTREDFLGKSVSWEYTPSSDDDQNWNGNLKKQQKSCAKGKIVGKKIVEGVFWYEIKFDREDWENNTVDEKGAAALVKQYEKDSKKKRGRKRKRAGKK